jgi:hypothetical protein
MTVQEGTRSTTPVAPPRARRARRLALALWVAALALVVVFVVLVFVNAPSPGPLEFADVWIMVPIYAAAMMMLPSVGALIASRQPGNSIGWLFCFAGIAMAAGFSLQLYGDSALHLHPAWPAGAVALSIGNPLFLTGMVSGTFVLMFLFPTGRPMPGAWSWVFRVLSFLFLLGVLGSLIASSLQFPYDDLPNPLHVPLLDPAQGITTVILDGMAPVVALLSVAALVGRFRRSRGSERQQMKWFAYAAGFMGSSLALGFSFSALGWQLASDVLWVTAMVSLALLPVAVGVAILRYRLYEIDRIVSRTVSYALVTGVLIAVYAGGVMLLGRVLAPFTRESEVAVAASTLLVAALFQPVRRRVQALVDRRFNRERYDAQRTVEGFAAALRDEVHLEDVSSRLLAAVSTTVAPVQASLWLRGSEERA